MVFYNKVVLWMCIVYFSHSFSGFTREIW